MTAPGQTTNAQQDAPGSGLGTAQEQTTGLTGTAASAAGAAKEQAGNVVGETLEQAKNLTAELQGSARAQIDKQSETVAVQLRALSQQLRDGDTSGLAGKLMTEAGERLQSLSRYIDRVGPQGLVEEVRRYARRNPGTFFLTAALAGLVSGRLAKAAKAGPATPADELPGRHATPTPGLIPATDAPVAGVDLTGTPVVPTRSGAGGLR